MRKNSFRLQKRLSLIFCFTFPATAAYLNDKNREMVGRTVAPAVVSSPTAASANAPLEEVASIAH